MSIHYGIIKEHGRRLHKSIKDMKEENASPQGIRTEFLVLQLQTLIADSMHFVNIQYLVVSRPNFLLNQISK